MNLMSKERLIAFTDAVLAIIMTILVLELERPNQISWQALWDLRTGFFAYTISFFWLGTMWVNLHRSWDVVDKIKKVKTGNKGFHQDVPTEDVVITSVSVE